ncbi:MAG: hypothetical protein ACK5M4_13685 [Pseudorhodobacter sp.]
MELPAGTVFERMSYAKNGVAYASAKMLKLQDAPVRGKGYAYQDRNGEERYFMIIEEYGDKEGCQNWAIARPYLDAENYGGAPYVPNVGGKTPPRISKVRTPVTGGGGGGALPPPVVPFIPVTGGSIDPTFYPTTGGEYSPTPATAPVPAAGILLISALIGGIAISRRKTGRS